LSRRLAARVVISLIVASMLLTDLGVGMWLAPRATAQTAAPYHWARKRSHFRLRVGDNVSGDWNAYLRAALSDWNQNETVALIEVEGSTNPQYCQPVSGRVEVCDWWYGTQTGWLGLTRIYFNASGDHIDAATVQLNNSFLYAPNSPYNNDAARRHTLCHELGHTLGLDHPVTTSCMNNSQHAVFNYVTPLNEDFRNLRRIYEHQDTTRTVAQASEIDLSLFAPASSPEVDSEEDVMVLPLDEGTTVLTFITWADEFLPQTGVDTTLEEVLSVEPTVVDSDGDHVADADELSLYRTDPTVADTDGDGTPDGVELFGSQTDPLLWDEIGNASSSEIIADTGVLTSEPADSSPGTEPDLDADNYADAAELEIGLDPGNPDTDGDTVADGDELGIYGTDPLTWDSDGDGLSDGEELFATETDPLIEDTSGAGP
jgi:Bacterial TSP3 repeat